MTTLTTAQLERANIPERYWQGISLVHLPAQAPYGKTVKRYFALFDDMLEEGIGLYLWSSENGTGKTSIAILAGLWALLRGRSVYYFRSEELREAVVKDREFSEGVTVKDRALTVDFLILDDLGKEYKNSKSGYTESVIENVIRERIQRKRVTFITSNVKPQGLAQMFGEDIPEVMKEGLVTVHIVGPDQGGKLWREEKRRAIRDKLFGEAS